MCAYIVTISAPLSNFHSLTDVKVFVIGIRCNTFNKMFFEVACVEYYAIFTWSCSYKFTQPFISIALSCQFSKAETNTRSLHAQILMLSRDNELFAREIGIFLCFSHKSYYYHFLVRIYYDMVEIIHPLLHHEIYQEIVCIGFSSYANLL